MKKYLAMLCAACFFGACGQTSGSKSVEGEWTENQEIHFYKDCKDKMLELGESEENANAFCECCLLKLKDQFANGREAVDQLTDDQIKKIESECGQG